MLLNLEIKLEGLAKCIRRVQTKLLERSLPMIKILKKGVLKQYPFFIHVGGERPCKGKVSCPRMQHNVPSQESNSTTQSRDIEAHYPWGHQGTHLLLKFSFISLHSWKKKYNTKTKLLPPETSRTMVKIVNCIKHLVQTLVGWQQLYVMLEINVDMLWCT